MNHDEKDDRDDVWDLLGKAPARKARPAFLQDVLRAVRQSEPEATKPEIGFLAWLKQGWNWLALTGAVAAVVFVTLAGQTSSPQGMAPALAANEATVIDEAAQNGDLDVLRNLDVLLALDDSNVWLDSSLR